MKAEFKEKRGAWRQKCQPAGGGASALSQGTAFEITCRSRPPQGNALESATEMGQLVLEPYDRLEGRITSRRRIRVIIAGGGTGGHLFPAIAIANELSARPGGAEIQFVTGRRRLESEVIARYGFRQTSIDVEGLKGRGWKRGAVTAMKLPWSFYQAVSIIRGFSPHIVIGVGGYSSGPVCLAARWRGIPCAIQEQNSFPGLTNRLLCRIVDKVFVSFEESRAHLSCGSVVWTGNPVRKELLEQAATGLKEEERFCILVVGGSQGARAVNEAFLSALEILVAGGKEVRVIHQSGEADFGRVAQEYKARGLMGDVRAFIQDMAWAYAQADLVVSRAGATTLSELTSLGKPSILIPYPYAANNHQELNARSTVQAGGAEMILQKELSGERLAGVLMSYMEDPHALKRMAEAAGRMGRPNAVEVIVDNLMEMVRT
jgi:UDP-N-acetylglucosamine--N-acetylmuramyl-(pentapeptide) pyrophosphoryl-undecaprenol N-acetylglucosamine transferase